MTKAVFVFLSFPPPFPFSVSLSFAHFFSPFPSLAPSLFLCLRTHTPCSAAMLSSRWYLLPASWPCSSAAPARPERTAYFGRRRQTWRTVETRAVFLSPLLMTLNLAPLPCPLLLGLVGRSVGSLYDIYFPAFPGASRAGFLCLGFRNYLGVPVLCILKV